MPSIYEIRRSGETLCRSSIPGLGYAPQTLRDMDKAGLHLYKDGKREKPPRSCQIGSGNQK